MPDSSFYKTQLKPAKAINTGLETKIFLDSDYGWGDDLIKWTLLDILSTDLGGIRFGSDYNQEEKFRIEVSKTEMHEFYDGLVVTKYNPQNKQCPNKILEEKCQKTKRPITELKVVVNPKNFTLADVPDLIQAVTSQHNQWLENNYPDKNETELELWSLPVTELKFAIQARALADTLETALEKLEVDGNQPEKSEINQNEGQSNQGNLEKIKFEIGCLKTSLEEIASKYGVEEGLNILPHPKQKKIEEFVKKVTQKPDKFLGKLPLISRIVTTNIRESMDQEITDIMFARSMSEFIRLTDLDGLFKTSADLKKMEINTLKNIYESQKLKKDKQEQLLKEYKENISPIQELQSSLKDAQTPAEKTKIEIKIAKLVHTFIHDEFYFRYNAYSPEPVKSMYSRYVNCVTIGFIQKTVFQKYFGIEVLGANTLRHFFTVLPLSDGTFYDLENLRVLEKDGQPITQLQKYNRDTNYPTNFGVGKFEEGFIISLMFMNLYKDYTNAAIDSRVAIEKIMSKHSRSNRDVTLFQNLAVLYTEMPDIFIGKFGSLDKVVLKAEEIIWDLIRLPDRDISDSTKGLLNKKLTYIEWLEELYEDYPNIDFQKKNKYEKYKTLFLKRKLEADQESLSNMNNSRQLPK